MNKPRTNQFKKIAAFLILNVLVLAYLEYGISDEDRYKKGLIAYQEDNYSKTYNIMSYLADKEYADGEYMLAILYTKGQGVEADEKLAAYWYKQAAKHGNIKAEEFIRSNGITVD